MKIISLTLIAIISFPTLIKAPSSYVPSGTPFSSAGGASSGINPPTGPGYKSGDPGTGYKSGGPSGYKSGDTSNGYKNGSPPAKRAGGGDSGVAIVVFPKKPKKATPVPPECKSVGQCFTTHLAGDSPKEPQYHGPCCTKFKTAVPCVCKFLMSADAKQKRAGDGVVRGCHFKNPICIKKAMPPTCRPEVKHCVEMHMFRKASNPTFRSPCCQKFKTSKRCVMAFKNSPDPHLSQAAKGVIEGCQFF